MNTAVESVRTGLKALLGDFTAVFYLPGTSSQQVQTDPHKCLAGHLAF